MENFDKKHITARTCKGHYRMVKCPNCWGNSAYERKDGSIRCRSCGFDGHPSSLTKTTEETYNKWVGAGLIFQFIVVAIWIIPTGSFAALIIAEIFLGIIGIFCWQYFFIFVMAIVDSHDWGKNKREKDAEIEWVLREKNNR